MHWNSVSSVVHQLASEPDHHPGSLIALEVNVSLDGPQVPSVFSSSSSSAEVDDDDAIKLSVEMFAVGIVLCLIIIFTLLGNGLVVGAVLFFRRLRSITNYFVVSLAVADLTVAVLVMPYSVIYEMTGRWSFSWIVCYFWISCDVMCCTSSILHLCVIAIDRYLAITEPLTYTGRMSKRRAALVIGAVWTCSAAISFVPIFTGWFADLTLMTLYENSPDCGLHVNPIYAVVSSGTSFYLPLSVMAIVYARIFHIARHQSKEIRKLEDSLDRDGASRMQKRAARRNSRDSKAVKTLGTLMGLFCLSWLPFFVVYVVKPFCQRCAFPPVLISVITWLGYCNSFFNPCVYALINRDFRFAYKSMLLCQRSMQGSRRRTLPVAQHDTDRLNGERGGNGGAGGSGRRGSGRGGSGGGFGRGAHASKSALDPRDFDELELQSIEARGS